MGASKSSPAVISPTRSYEQEEKEPTSSKKRQYHEKNIHSVLSDIKVHTVVSSQLDHDHVSAMRIPLGEVNDEQLLAEVARRKLDLHSKINDKVVKETYEVGRVLGTSYTSCTPYISYTS